MLHSIVEYYAEHESYRCGYCKKPDTNFSHGMWAHAMTVSDYQDLIDRGWRRSGKYCYKPTMDVTCCPMYTIRCRALEFKATKSQKKVLKNFNKYLMGAGKSDCPASDLDRKMSTSSSGADAEETMGSEQFVENKRDHQDINIHDVFTHSADTERKECNNLHVNLPINRHADSGSTQMVISKSETVPEKQKEVKKGAGPDPAKAPCKKAKQMRLERKLEKLKEKGVDYGVLNNSSKNKEKQIEDFLNDLPEDVNQRLEIKLVRTAPPSPEWLATAKETHEVYVKYQMIVHNDKPEKCTEPKFKDFLVASPLLEEHTATGPPCGYGSFHQQYWLDGKIIAVGVIDILPKCVSSVYFFYDPHYMNLSLGTYGALREIAFTRYLHTLCPQLKYYYMGYYIHSCRKMRYKGNFYPSDLLCPESYKWFPLKECVPKLEQSSYSRLNPDIDSVDNNFPKDDDINFIPILVKGVVLQYEIYKTKVASRSEDDIKELIEYARLVGAKTAKSLILVR